MDLKKHEINVVMSKSDATLESWGKRLGGGGKEKWKEKCLSENASNAPRHQG